MLIKFFRLKKSRKILLAESLLLAVYSYFLFSYHRKNARFGSKNPTNSPDKKVENHEIFDVRFAILILQKYIPWNFKCRHQAWIAGVLLKKKRIPFTVFVGIKKNATDHMEGHAWTMAENIMVSGFCNPADFTVLNTFKG
jgi:hypothetical protein